MGALAGGLAHDFNNILTTISGYAELSLDESRQNAYLNDNLSRILSAVNRARSLTQQILTFSRHIEQEKVPVNPWFVLRETLTLVKSTIGSGITLVDNTFDTGTIVYADPTQLFRVFMNLINNALQAMENKGGELVISQKGAEITRNDEVDTDTSGSRFYEVTVSDTGTGMDKAVIDRIFEPFFTTKPIGKGTGLGLSVVHGIINELGGIIDVESKSGEGTTFTVRIPLMDHSQSAAVNNGASASIICISDNVSESRMLCLGLEMAGYSLSYATSPETFLKLVLNRKNPPDLVLFMDDLHGFPISDLNLLYRKSGIKVPLLIISGSQDLILEESFLNSDSARHFLHKPVSLREVRNEIEVAVRKK